MHCGKKGEKQENMFFWNRGYNYFLLIKNHLDYIYSLKDH